MAWHGVFHVFEASGMPQELIYGVDLIPTPSINHRRPATLTPAGRSGARLARTTAVADLVESVDAETVRTAKLYSVGQWDEDDRSFVTEWARDLPAFTTAAGNGDAMIIEVSF